MKILVTSFTVSQSTETHVKVFIDVLQYMIDIMRSQGHVVDRKVLKIEEDLSEYDLVVLSVAPLYSIVNGLSLQCLTSIYKSKVPTVIFWTDWKVKNSISNARSIVNGNMFDKWKDKFFVRTEGPVTDFQRECILNYANSLTGVTQFPDHMKICLIPAYAKWGDKSILAEEFKPFNEVKQFDPFPFVKLITPKETPMCRVWVLSALNDWSYWIQQQGFKWAVQAIGNRKTTYKFSTELEVQEYHNKHIGVVLPEYYHSGCGWSRTRYLYSANTRNVMYTNRRDAAALDEAIGPGARVYSYSLKAIEGFSDNDLRMLADVQSRAFFKKLMSTKEESIEQVKGLCNAYK